MIVELGSRYGNEGLTVYFVSVDWLDYQNRVMAFLNKREVKGLSFIKNQKDEPFINGIAEEWTGAVPFTVVYGKQSGEEIVSWEGKAQQETFIAAIQAALVN